jgi:tryptophan synthase alpha chain
MTRIETTFERLKKENKKGFIAYITGGDPSLTATRDMVLRLEDNGVDIIEIGMPFSDPLADGGVNQAAATRALNRGANPDWVLENMASIREKTEMPVLFYTYFNLLIPGGVNKSLKRVERSGADGLLVLDLPAEEMGPYRKYFEASPLNNIRLVTPTSPKKRIQSIVKDASGFVYCVSRAGVTGMQDKLADDAGDLVKRTRSCTKLPVALGFGISNPAQAAEAARLADAVVVGSAIVDKFYREKNNPEGRRNAARWVGKMVKAVKKV